MDAFIDHPQWFEYIETPVRRKRSAPVKLDTILAERMRAFVRAKATRQDD